MENDLDSSTLSPSILLISSTTSKSTTYRPRAIHLALLWDAKQSCRRLWSSLRSFQSTAREALFALLIIAPPAGSCPAPGYDFHKPTTLRRRSVIGLGLRLGNIYNSSSSVLFLTLFKDLAARAVGVRASASSCPLFFGIHHRLLRGGCAYLHFSSPFVASWQCGHIFWASGTVLVSPLHFCSSITHAFPFCGTKALLFSSYSLVKIPTII